MAIELDMLRRYSDDDIAELSRRNEPYLFERLPDGQLVVSPPSGWFGGSREARLVAQVSVWNSRAGGGGEVFSSSAAVGYARAARRQVAAWRPMT